MVDDGWMIVLAILTVLRYDVRCVWPPHPSPNTHTHTHTHPHMSLTLLKVYFRQKEIFTATVTCLGEGRERPEWLKSVVLRGQRSDPLNVLTCCELPRRLITLFTDFLSSPRDPTTLWRSQWGLRVNFFFFFTRMGKRMWTLRQGLALKKCFRALFHYYYFFFKKPWLFPSACRRFRWKFSYILTQGRFQEERVRRHLATFPSETPLCRKSWRSGAGWGATFTEVQTVWSALSAWILTTSFFVKPRKDLQVQTEGFREGLVHLDIGGGRVWRGMWELKSHALLDKHATPFAMKRLNDLLFKFLFCLFYKVGILLTWEPFLTRAHL